MLLSSLFLLGCFNCNVNAVEQSSYRLGIFPYMSTIRLEQEYSATAVAFSQILKKPVRLGTARNFKKFRSRLKKGDFDIALIPPFDIVPVVDRAGYLPLARRPSKSASIVVRLDSKVKKINDLRGKKIGLPVDTPVSIFLQLTLNEHGLKKNKDVYFKNFNSVPSCLHKLLLQKIDACGSASGIGLKMFQKKTGLKVREIIKTRTFPHMLFVAHPRLSAIIRDKLKKALIEGYVTNSGKTLLVTSNNDISYIPYKKTDYDIIREYRALWMNDAKNSL